MQQTQPLPSSTVSSALSRTSASSMPTAPNSLMMTAVPCPSGEARKRCSSVVLPLPTSWHSDQIVLGTFFNGGLRAYDISNPYQPKEVGIFMPPAPPGAPTGTIQMNDVFVDERAIVYTVDRHIGGLYILEMDF